MIESGKTTIKYRQELISGRSRTAATSKMEHFVVIVNAWKPLTIITNCSILDVAAALDPPLIPTPHLHIYHICCKVLTCHLHFARYHAKDKVHYWNINSFSTNWKLPKWTSREIAELAGMSLRNTVLQGTSLWKLVQFCKYNLHFFSQF